MHLLDTRTTLDYTASSGSVSSLKHCRQCAFVLPVAYFAWALKMGWVGAGQVYSPYLINGPATSSVICF